jgi:NAD(P)-dependent dehydrogenase (short-subunit alcohol dehydrogenase family)
MQPYRVLVLGGYGFFGRRLVERLAGRTGLHLVICGRSQEKGERLALALGKEAASTLEAAVVDANSEALEQALSAHAPDAVIHASGPFQSQSYRVAEACIAIGAHYIDLADGRDFVLGIGSLDGAAREAGICVLSGASSVPALSSAAADHLATGLQTVQTIDVGISPGNRTERGLSTVQAILSYCGKPLPTSKAQPVYGWAGTVQHAYSPPVGVRLLSPCDVPDLVLLPPRYPGSPTVAFGAGLELQFLHRGMNVMAALTRLGVVRDWSVYASLLKRMADWFQHVGSDAGAMHVGLTGLTPEGQPVTRTWELLATHGDGPYVPTLAAAALVRKLQEGAQGLIGAKPCVGVLSLDDFSRECLGLRISTTELLP